MDPMVPLQHKINLKPPVHAAGLLQGYSHPMWMNLKYGNMEVNSEFLNLKNSMECDRSL